MKKIVHYIGLDVHKETIAVAIASQNTTEVRSYGIIGGTLDAIDKLLKKLSAQNVELRFVYEAGPFGFVIHRYLKSKGIHCDVVSPSLIPKKASDRVKTDRRDAAQLARLYRAGELRLITCQIRRMKPFAIWCERAQRRSVTSARSAID